MFATDRPPPAGWDGTAPQGCIVPPDLCTPSSPDCPPAGTYHSLPVDGNYPEPVPASDRESEVRYLLSALLHVSLKPALSSLGNAKGL